MTRSFEIRAGRDIVARWRILAEKRLDYLTELYDTGRWRRYHREADFLVMIRETRRAVDLWRELAPDNAMPTQASVTQLSETQASVAQASSAQAPSAQAPSTQVSATIVPLDSVRAARAEAAIEHDTEPHPDHEAIESAPAALLPQIDYSPHRVSA